MLIANARLVDEPEIKRCKNSKGEEFSSLNNVSVAIRSSARKDSDGKYVTDFFRLRGCNGGKADFLAKWFSKGDPIMVVGEPYEEEWEKDGIKNKALCLYVTKIGFVEGAPLKKSANNSTDASAPASAPMEMPDTTTFVNVGIDSDIPAGWGM